MKIETDRDTKDPVCIRPSERNDLRSERNKLRDDLEKSHLQVDAYEKAIKRVVDSYGCDDSAMNEFNCAPGKCPMCDIRGMITPNDTRQMTAGEMAKGPKGPVPQSVKDACTRAVSDIHPQEIESNDSRLDASGHMMNCECGDLIHCGVCGRRAQGIH